MQLDYIHQINETEENIVRLYDFDMAQAILFRNAVLQLISDKQEIVLDTQPYIQARNCNLILRIADEDIGIITEDTITFYCDLTLEGFKEMEILLQPFCNKETKGYQWLYDIDNETDFLFSPAGSW